MGWTGVRRAPSPVRAYLPLGARVRRDRGPGLYVAREAVQSPWFVCEAAGVLWRLTPAPALLSAFERNARPAREFSRFRGLPVEAESVRLFCEAAKLLEAPEAARVAALDRALRRRAALCLRAGGGGGLAACAALRSLIGGNEK